MILIPHNFESITEQQWKSGKNRHKCAICRDYGDLVHLPLPLLITKPTIDHFNPSAAQIVLEAVQEYSEETVAVAIQVWAIEAETEQWRN